jgi:hypothetical protein
MSTTTYANIALFELLAHVGILLCPKTWSGYNKIISLSIHQNVKPTYFTIKKSFAKSNSPYSAIKFVPINLYVPLFIQIIEKIKNK